jgi:hypothetical protein
VKLKGFILSISSSLRPGKSFSSSIRLLPNKMLSSKQGKAGEVIVVSFSSSNSFKSNPNFEASTAL